MHQTAANVLRATLNGIDVCSPAHAEQIVDNALAACMHAMRCSNTKSIDAAPGSLAYGRDVFLDLPFCADLLAVDRHRQRQQMKTSDVRTSNVVNGLMQLDKKLQSSLLILRNWSLEHMDLMLLLKHAPMELWMCVVRLTSLKD